MARNYNDMTRGPVWKCIVTFALPIMLGQLLQQLYSTVDGIVVGNYISSGALAAVGSCGTITFIFIAFCGGMANGSGVVISQFFGAGRKEEMRSTAANILLLLVGLAVVMTVIGTGFANFIAADVLSIREPEIRQQAAVYLRIYSIGLIFTFIYNAVAAILRGVGDSKAVLYFLLVSTVMNTILDIVFVSALGMGVAGAAWATVISQVACTVVSLFYMFKNYPDFRFRSVKELKYDREKMRLCLKLGIPTTLQQLIVSCGHLVLQRLVNSFGEVTMAATTVGSRFEHYCAIPTMGVMQGMTSFTGQNTGAGKPERVKQGLKVSILMNVGAIAVISAVLYVLAPQLGKLFGVKGEALDQTVQYMHWLSVAYPVFALYVPLNGLFQGSGDPLAAAAVSLVALAVRVSAAYVLARVFDVGYSSCWKTYIIGWAMALVVAVIYYYKGNWRKKSIVTKKATEADA